MPHLSVPIGWQASYVGLPWVWRARGPRTYDCWGFVCGVWRDLHNITLPDYLDKTPKDSAARDRYRISARCLAEGKDIMTPLTRPEPLAICLMRHGAFPSHVGLYAHGGRIIHACEHAGRIIQSRITDIHPKIIGYYWPSDFIVSQSQTL